MGPEMYDLTPVVPGTLRRGDTILWRGEARCVCADAVSRIAEGGMRFDYDVRLTDGTVRVRGDFKLRKITPKKEVA